MTNLPNVWTKQSKHSGSREPNGVAEAITHFLLDQWPDGLFELAVSREDDNEADISDENLKLLREGVAEMEEAIRKMRKSERIWTDDFDIAIATISMGHKCGVITANLQHFERIKDLESKSSQ
jgi:hypothetical protein